MSPAKRAPGSTPARPGQRPSPRAFDEKRAQIAALAGAPPAVAVAGIREHLADRNGYLAGEAAEVAARLELRQLGPDLAAALRRLIAEGLAADKGCLGKRKILESMLALEVDEPEAYLAGLRYAQPEPAFGGPVDSAGPLRGLCAHALVQVDYPAAVAEITPLLVDPDLAARVEAAQALGRSGILAAAPVLHLKVLAGDAEPDVLQCAYRGLLRLDPRRYLPVVAGALGAGGTPAEAAALALGESRLPEALPLLKEGLLAAGPRSERGVLVAIAIARSDEAIDFLVSLVAQAPEGRAAAAIEALALHRHDEKVAERVRSAVEARGGKKLLDALHEHFR